jgi:hypothetical protein
VLTYHRLGLTRLARRIFAGLDAAAAGPKLSEGAARFIRSIDSEAASPGTAGKHLARADASERLDPALAFDHASEAFLRSTTAPERERAAQSIIRLSQALTDPTDALDLLGSGTELSPATELELARVALRAGDRSRAASLLEDARRRGDAMVKRAADQLATQLR